MLALVCIRLLLRSPIGEGAPHGWAPSPSPARLQGNRIWLRSSFSSPLPLGEREASEASRERAVAAPSGVATSLSPALRADPLPQGEQFTPDA